MPEKPKPLTVRDVVAHCGGVQAIAKALDLSESMITKWLNERREIKDRYWAKMIKLSKGRLSVEALFDLNERIRRKNRRRKT